MGRRYSGLDVLERCSSRQTQEMTMCIQNPAVNVFACGNAQSAFYDASG